MQQREYKDTVTLPKTSFAMRAGLPQKEVNFLKKWEEENLWQALRHKSRNAKRYIIHDGPPYANGHLHIGHALNKILKDLINRSYQMMGYDAHYVPGWDCHGLPIEWKIEEQLRAKGKNKDDLPINSFRKLCRNFAQKWIDIQINEFKRLGVSANWDHPYKTMDFESEALIVKEIGKFLLNGSLYLGKKPVFWSIVERTALAEAEIEYKDHVSVSVDIGFEIVESVQSDLIGAHVVIWTTTPWTLPANRAIAFNDKFSYGLYHINGFLEGSQSAVSPNVRIIIADRLWPDFIRKCRLDENQCKRLGDIDAQILSRTICAHPWADHGYDHKIHCYHGDFVSDQTGTGFVHIAPTHGHEDYELSLKYGFTGFDTVGEDGVFMDHVPIFAGTSVYDFEGKKGTAEKPIIEMLKKVKKLYAIEKIKHSYPHSWRSKAPLIFRNTSQWFISMSENNLREKALKAIDDTVFFPPQGQKRLYDMIEQRPDWCLSRQRFWGVPIAIFKHVKTGQPLRDSKIMENIEKAFAEHGSDIWYDADPRQFLTPEYNKDEWSPVYDVADVWFDSGSTHAFVLEQRKELKWPADLYLEGSDQHRGWFHSSMLESCATRGRAPCNHILTHGFVLAEDGQKMSKSIGNVITPETVIKQYGADILRLWVVASNYHDDLSIGPSTLKQHSETYRRLRNCLRWLLGNLNGYSPSPRYTFNDKKEIEHLEEPERWILNQLSELSEFYEKQIKNYQFHLLFKALHHFCTHDLSAFYFDIRKDSLYCDDLDDPLRQSILGVLDQIFNHLVRWLAPILCFTSEEAWITRMEESANPDDLQKESIHLQNFVPYNLLWRDLKLADKWKKLRQIRKVILGAIEIAREQKILGASLEAKIRLYVPSDQEFDVEVDLLTIVTIVSQSEIVKEKPPKDAFCLDDVPGYAVVVERAHGQKCQRCWNIFQPATKDSCQKHNDLCARCQRVIDKIDLKS